ncbi:MULTISPECIES: hypothetical protein [unclassified Tenacibaculum]|uniref:DUF7674 family protein n=1 Tax=unclassified Tenacibaculum TaxID=2635139 RepID=UPI001F23079F|nr:MULTISPECIES: hypothetical protein [unclassified Tenacibaculum]MCF2875568.1 hypothetical protein [Tenacibaculum sp. Cn5-1]MCF2935644.1 hypothetical protein [Tenacibaculum sp. Cn5-34]MCG7512204.1 hypothetical protein [Tenacibaculum sp. Cn5-46]
MNQKEITYSDFYELIFKVLPDFREMKVFEQHKNELNDDYIGMLICNELANKMMKETELGNKTISNKLLELIEEILVKHPDSIISSLIGTEFIVSILEYPMKKELKINLLKQMKKETIKSYKIAKQGYKEVFL